jgi:hypothetical protein
VGDPLGQQQGTILVAAWAQTSLAAGKRDEHFVATVGAGASHPGEAEVEIAAAEELAYYVADDGAPKAVTFFVPVGIDLFELRDKPFDDAV